MSSGELRFLVEVQKIVDVESDIGDSSVSAWTKHCDAWASIISLSGKESVNDIDSTMGRAKIKIRYRDDIENSMRVLANGLTYEIEDNFDIAGRRKYLTLMVKVVNK